MFIKYTKVLLRDVLHEAGQSRFQSLIPMYIAEADVLLIVYDITKTESFACARRWVESIQDGLGPSGALLALVANKADQRPRAVPAEEVQEFCKERKMIFAETSAKTGENVSALFAEISEQLPGRPKVLPQRLGMSLDSDEEDPQMAEPPRPRLLIGISLGTLLFLPKLALRRIAAGLDHPILGVPSRVDDAVLRTAFEATSLRRGNCADGSHSRADLKVGGVLIIPHFGALKITFWLGGLMIHPT
eukprot:s1097_g9.t1